MTTFIDRTVEPAERFIRLTEGDVNGGDGIARKVFRARLLETALEDQPCFSVTAGFCIRDGETGNRLLRDIARFLVDRDRFREASLFAIRGAKR